MCAVALRLASRLKLASGGLPVRPAALWLPPIAWALVCAWVLSTPACRYSSPVPGPAVEYDSNGTPDAAWDICARSFLMSIEQRRLFCSPATVSP